MPNWSESMQQSFEYYVVDPTSWKDIKRIRDVKSCTITRDTTVETLGSASISVAESLGECYIRVYMITLQNGIEEKHPLGTFLVQTPSTSFDGKTTSVSLDAYTSLLELKENKPPLGYYVKKDENIMTSSYRIAREKARAPIVFTETDDTLHMDFVANTNDTWLTFLSDLILNAKYEFGLDELGRILFLPRQDTASLQPVWTYNDDNSSILYPSVTLDHDLYGIPNVVEVTYSENNHYYYARVVNDDPNSPTSTISRGREITHYDNKPALSGNPTKEQIERYAEQLLRDLSSIEYKISYSHGYCPVRVGDCVRLNYTRAGLNGVKARVISQSIKCEEGCEVTEKAVFTAKLWR